MRSEAAPATCFTTEKRGNVAVIRFAGDIYELGARLELKSEFFTTIRTLDDDPHVRVLVLMNEPGVLDEEPYLRFVDRAADAESGSWTSATPDYGALSLYRFGHALDQTVQALLSCHMVVIAALSGDVASPFFGASLAADYRFAADGMRYRPSHALTGIISGNGPGFSTPHLCSRRAARDLLLATYPIPASKLQHSGLVDACVPEVELENVVMEFAAARARMPLSVIAEAKEAMRGTTCR